MTEISKEVLGVGMLLKVFSFGGRQRCILLVSARVLHDHEVMLHPL